MPDIAQLYDQHLAAERDRRGQRRSRSYANNASELGDRCLRKLVYRRVAPEEAAPVDTGLMRIFRWGDEVERYVRRSLAEAGTEITHAQISGRWEQYNIAGHIDGMLRDPETGQLEVVEIKGMNPFTWAKWNTVADFEGDWLGERYLAQLVLYLWLQEVESGLFLLFNKSSAEIKTIAVRLEDHLELAEGLLEKAEKIEGYVKKWREWDERKLPDSPPLPEQLNERAVCERCPFVAFCCPTLSYGPEVEVIEDGALRWLLLTWEDARDAKAEADKAWKGIKGRFPEEGEWMVGCPGSKAAGTPLYWKIRAKRDKRGALRLTVERAGEAEGDD